MKTKTLKFLFTSCLALLSLPTFGSEICQKSILRLKVSFNLKHAVEEPILTLKNKKLGVTTHREQFFLIDKETKSDRTLTPHFKFDGEAWTRLQPSRDGFIIGYRKATHGAVTFFDADGVEKKHIETDIAPSTRPLIFPDGSLVVATGSVKGGSIHFFNPDGELKSTFQPKYPVTWLHAVPEVINPLIIAKGRDQIYWLDRNGNKVEHHIAKAASYSPSVSPRGVVGWPTDAGTLFIFSPSGKIIAEYRSGQDRYIPDYGTATLHEDLSTKPAYFSDGEMITVGGGKDGIKGPIFENVHFINVAGDELKPSVRVEGQAYVPPVTLENNSSVVAAGELAFFNPKHELTKKIKRSPNAIYPRIISLPGNRVAVAEHLNLRGDEKLDARILIFDDQGNLLSEFKTGYDVISKIQIISENQIAVSAWNIKSGSKLFILDLI